FHDPIHVDDIQAVATQLRTVDLHVQVFSARDRFHVQDLDPGNTFKRSFYLLGDRVDRIQVLYEYLYSIVGTDTGGQHVDQVDVRLGPAIHHTWDLQLGVQFTDNVFLGNAFPPLGRRFEHDNGLDHAQRRVVRSGTCPPCFAQNLFHLGDGFNDLV